MNKEFIQVDDNLGFVIDDDGDMLVVKKDNRDYEFENILSLENEVENSSNELEKLYSKRHIIKEKIIRVKNLFLLSAFLDVFAIFSSLIGYYNSVFITEVIAINAIVVSLGVGFGITSNKEKKIINPAIESLEQDILEKNKVINLMKEKVKYRANILNKDDDYTFDNSIELNNNSRNVKVLRLVKDKENR